VHVTPARIGFTNIFKTDGNDNEHYVVVVASTDVDSRYLLSSSTIWPLSWKSTGMSLVRWKDENADCDHVRRGGTI
jgi:hypothetical protein